MPLPREFALSQSSLQDYEDCPRRFELRYLLKVQWPALESEPVLEQEAHRLQGERFHHRIHQWIAGLPVHQQPVPAADADLARWWQNFLQGDPLSALPARRWPEYTLNAPFAGIRLTAKYDILAVEPGQRAVIVDWKTSRRRTPGKLLRRRWQSRLYPLLLVLAGAHLNAGQPLQPEQVEMIYWFADFPNEPERWRYSAQDFERDQAALQAHIADLQTRPSGQFPMTVDTRACQYCVYRSLCDRGVSAGPWEEELDADEPQPGSVPLTVDFDQIGEIEF